MIPPFLLGFLNPAKILEFFLKYWKQLLVIAVCVFIYFQHSKISSLQEEVASLNSALEVCASGNAALSADIDARNAEITKWKEISEDLEAKNFELQKRVGALRKETENKVGNVLSEPTPESCEAAIQYLRDGVEEVTPW